MNGCPPPCRHANAAAPDAPPHASPRQLPPPARTPQLWPPGARVPGQGRDAGAGAPGGGRSPAGRQQGPGWVRRTVGPGARCVCARTARRDACAPCAVWGFWERRKQGGRRAEM
eukprot:XP_001691354.1 predicted protein [Chlamydomonas reinhardtii]